MLSLWQKDETNRPPSTDDHDRVARVWPASRRWDCGLNCVITPGTSLTFLFVSTVQSLPVDGYLMSPSLAGEHVVPVDGKQIPEDNWPIFCHAIQEDTLPVWWSKLGIFQEGTIFWWSFDWKLSPLVVHRRLTCPGDLCSASSWQSSMVVIIVAINISFGRS